MFHTILVAIDPTPARHSAIGMAGDMAHLTGAAVQVLHVVPSTAAWDAVVPLEEESEAKSILRETLSLLREAGIAAQGELVHAMVGAIPATIFQAARQHQADLLVLSPHHRSAAAAFFHPRVSDAVAHHSEVAVLLAPERPAPSAP